MLKKRLGLVALAAVFALVVAACGDDTADTTTTAAPATTAATTTTAAPTTTEAMMAFQACQVSDVAGIDDKSFNETAWAGMQQAQSEFQIGISFLESTDATDYRPNIDAFIEQGCDIINTVGFLLAADTAQAAADNPDQLFAIVDYPTYLSAFDIWVEPFTDASTNVRGLNFQTDQAAFLAGYLAAGVSESHIIGNFGGVNIPPVTIFMDGFVRGAAHYDSVHGTTTTVLGWDPETQEGLFTNNFDSLDDGRTFGQNLIDEGADVIMPVAGPVGLGTAAAIQDANAGGASIWLIGVDADWTLTAPEYADVVLTSVLKKIDVAVFDSVKGVYDQGELPDLDFQGTLANGGVGLAGINGVASAELIAEVEQLEQDIIDGTVSISG